LVLIMGKFLPTRKCLSSGSSRAAAAAAAKKGKAVEVNQMHEDGFNAKR
jgi:hypothetical protein